ncbi:acetate kinase [[Eubacterium] cellulosolvens]
MNQFNDLTKNKKLLTLNCGSSSVKYSLWLMPEYKMVCNGVIDRIGSNNSGIVLNTKHGINFEHGVKIDSNEHAINLVLDVLIDPKNKILNSLSEIDAVVHRVVHGGLKFRSSTIINNAVLKEIENLIGIAPLHNPHNLLGIKTVMKAIPNIPQIAVFDTAFFSKIPPYAHMYGVPYEWFDKYRIRKYGFHGSSHLYVSRRASVMLGKEPSKTNIIVLHIGNGVSITAIKNGIAYDQSMGFTPLEGAIMGTRCGDIDPSIPLYVMEKEGLTARDMSLILNKKSGILGITRRYSDRRDLVEAVQHGDEKARLALDLECYRLKKYIGAYFAALGILDAIVFTAGVGEHSSIHREKVCSNLQELGIKLDKQKNKQVTGDVEQDISSKDSLIRIFVIPTREELVLIEDAFAILKGNYTNPDSFEYFFQKKNFSAARALKKL